MIVRLTAQDINTLLESVEASKKRVREDKGIIYDRRKEKMDLLDSAAEKLKNPEEEPAPGA